MLLQAETQMETSLVIRYVLLLVLLGREIVQSQTRPKCPASNKCSGRHWIHRPRVPRARPPLHPARPAACAPHDPSLAAVYPGAGSTPSGAGVASSARSRVPARVDVWQEVTEGSFSFFLSCAIADEMVLPDGYWLIVDNWRSDFGHIAVGLCMHVCDND